MSTVDLRFGDCLEVLRTLPDCSVHAVICDPPYGLADLKPTQIATAFTAWLNGDRDHVPDGRGFMGRAWDSFVPPPAVWDECLRVLKPGGHLAAFAGSRTYDLMGMSIRLAGFEIRDGLQWLYGSGMPKGQNVGKAIDKIAGRTGTAVDTLKRELRRRFDESGMTRSAVDAACGFRAANYLTVAEPGKRPDPWVNVLPSAEKWDVMKSVLGCGDELDEFFAAAEREITQHAARPSVPGDVIAFDQRASTERERRDIPATPEAARWEGWNTSLKPSQEPIVLARKPLRGTVAANVLATGCGAMNVDACRVASSEPIAAHHGATVPRDAMAGGVLGGYQPGDAGKIVQTAGRWPANVLFSHDESCHEPGECAPGCPVAELDAQSGTLRPGERPAKRSGMGYHDNDRNRSGTSGERQVLDSGGASKFYPTFRYQAKAPAAERPKIDGKGWPTVKPQGLMRWLVRLLTPPGGVVLDPFAGTGSTLQAACDEGFASIGIERDEFAYRLSCRRLGLPELVPATDTDEPVAQLPEPAPVDPLLAAIADASSYDELLALWREHRWDKDGAYNAAAAARRAELEGAAA